MRLLPRFTALKLQEILRIAVIAVSAVIITSSMMLFVADRGNIISYTREQVYGWRNPSIAEMQTFLRNDPTELHPFIDGSYECKQFCVDLIRNARAKGYRAGYVTLSNPLGDDHAIVCFDTTDEGVLFVEPQVDVVFTASELQQMLDENCYSIAVKGLPDRKSTRLNSSHYS